MPISHERGRDAGAGGAAPLLPSPLAGWDEIARAAAGRRIALFLDYDGTLTPIVARPEDAALAPEMRSRIAAAARAAVLAIVSGRDLADLRARVGLAGITYAGSHGFEIAAPGGPILVHERGLAFLSLLDAAEAELHRALARVPGVQVERKRFAIATHYRNVAEVAVAAVERAVAGAARRHPGLRRRPGKKVFELQPDIDWHKGHAVLWLLDRLAPAPAETLALYVGDDATDEDAFRALDGRGFGILVAEAPRATAARYRLADVAAVGLFLDRIAAAGHRRKHKPSKATHL
ncbi:MAG: trehalose-phosphatase [Proteobacteria bacterium]|nr:trehalose-phosphatase [Pseudomonadota bacterium]